jgi:hypothetical protein
LLLAPDDEDRTFPPTGGQPAINLLATIPAEDLSVHRQALQFLTVKDILEDKREFHTPTKMVSRISTAQGSLAL